MVLNAKVVKRSVVIGVHKTSVSLEEIFWVHLWREADLRSLQMAQLMNQIEAERCAMDPVVNMSSACRQHVMRYLLDRLKGFEEARRRLEMDRPEAGACGLS